MTARYILNADHDHNIPALPCACTTFLPLVESQLDDTATKESVSFPSLKFPRQSSLSSVSSGYAAGTEMAHAQHNLGYVTTV